MGSRKAEIFEKEDIEIAELAKAVGHPARVAILKELAKRNVCVCGDIVDVLPLAQSTVSQHLKELKAVGLISGTVAGVKSCYCINWSVMTRLQDLLACCFTPNDSSCGC